MKKIANKFSKWIFLSICLTFISNQISAQAYTNVYNGINYSSARPYNLNVIYFVPSDIPLDPTYKTRLSAILLWGQNYFQQSMIKNGYSPKTFGIYKETANRNNVEIIVIRGTKPHTSYTYNNRTTMDTEISTYLANNPTLKTSDHTLVITAVANEANADAPFFGIGKTAYVIDYPQFDIQYLGTDTYSFTGWFGGLMHELGHGLNLPHCAETKTEHNDPNKGITLMSFGNTTLGKSPTFINRAGAAVLNTCQIFADNPGTYYNGNTSAISSLHTTYTNGELVVSGTFQSDKTVTDVNFYQNPNQNAFPGNNSIAWSATPTGNNFSINMPVSELTYINQTYYLVIQLVLQNGESTYEYFPFSYTNGIPNIDFDFDTVSACVGGSVNLTSPISGISYQWQYQNVYGSWSNYPEGNVPAYANFTGTQAATMTISNISSAYINSPNKARVSVKKADGSTVFSQAWLWKVNGIITQPAALTTACVGGSLMLTVQASGASYQWQFENANGTWSNYPEGIVGGYATFSGTKTTSMTISNISANYINGNQARLLVTGSNGCTTASNTVTWKSQNCAARFGDDIKSASNITDDQSVYPNPVKDELTINLGSVKDNYQIEIINNMGLTVYKTTTSDQTLKVSLSDKLAGIYIVNIKGTATGSNKSIKIIKH